MSEKRKLRKGKVILTVAAIVILIAVIVTIILLTRKGKGGKNQDNPEKVGNDIFALPNITYTEMEVTNLEMEYLKENNETMVSMTINNTTERNVSKESVKAYLLDSNEKVLGQTVTYIESLAPGEQYSISVVLKGDLTSTTHISLETFNNVSSTETTTNTAANTTTNTTAANTTANTAAANQ